MKITVSISDTLEKKLRNSVRSERATISSFVKEAIDHYIKERKRRNIARKALELVNKTNVLSDALKELEEGRKDRDRF